MTAGDRAARLSAPSGVHPALAAVFALLEERGVRWCLLRWPANPGSPEGDVDLLVARGDLGRATKLLAELGFAPLPGWTRGRQAFLVGFHLPTARWLFLHVVTDLSFGRDRLLRTGAAGGCLARRRRVGVVAVPAPDDAFWALLLHCLLDKRAVAAHHRGQLQELAAGADPAGALARFVGGRCPAGWTASALAEAARRGDWAGLEGLAPALVASWEARDHVGWPRRWLARAVRLAERRALLWRRRGLSVALLGPDGAGKSTLAAGLRETFIFPVRVIYMGLHTPRLLRIARLQTPFLVVPGRLCILWGRYLLALYHRARGRLVIFDRYTFDALIPPRQQADGRQRCYRWLDAHACPPPDLVFMLDAGGEVMFDRKRHTKYGPEHLESARRHYLALAHRLPHFRVVDATRPPEEVRAEVTAQIWRGYAARWRGSGAGQPGRPSGRASGDE